jgi:hypothetical protein
VTLPSPKYQQGGSPIVLAIKIFRWYYPYFRGNTRGKITRPGRW